MVLLLITGWLVPVVIILFVEMFFVSNKMQNQIEKTAITSMDKVAANCEIHLNGAMAASRQATYSGIIRDSYWKYKKTQNEITLYNDILQFLENQYKHEQNFLGTVLYLTEDPGMFYYTYNNMGATYETIRSFKEKGIEVVQEVSRNLGTGIAFTEADGHLYMVRNLVMPDYKPFAVLVMELNKKNMFQGVEGTAWYLDSALYLDGVPLAGFGDFGEFPKDLLTADGNSHCLVYEGKTYVYVVSQIQNQTLTYVVLLDQKAMGYEQEMIRNTVLILLACMIPLIFMVFYFFHSRITVPIHALTQAATEIGHGNYGYELEPQMSSEEFHYLGDTFNRMSGRLKQQFEQIYLEELALKEANIKALQAQINPHFLNNTLEIINWEARLGENEKVCGMIEALSTMMEATTNRKKQKLIPLSEELGYVEAYLYIIEQRFGERLRIERSIDRELLQVQVPRLIIQPIIENAVEHGMDRRQGLIRIEAYRREDRLYIEITDNGSLTKEDIEKIEQLLEDTSNENVGKSVSMGISNVNKRLKIIYGEECGLTIKSNKDGNTVSTIMAKIYNNQ